MNGKDLKILLPLAVVIILILSVVGVLLMAGPSEDKKSKKEETGPYTMSVGPVTDEENKPIEGAIITLSNNEGKIGSEITNQDGIAEFSFDDKLEIGEYFINISMPGFVFKSFIVSLEYSGNNILLKTDNIEEKLKITRVKLPPLEFIVGPINGLTGPLAGVEIALKLDNATISIMYTDENGTATFTFDTPPADGNYILNISFEDYIPIEREIIIDYDNETHTLSVIGNFDGIFLEKPLPPLELQVGPVNGQTDVLKGVVVDLLFVNKLLSTANTDENGIAKFIFKTPPKDGDYIIRITATDYEVMNIEITIQYDNELHTLNIAGDISDITLTPIEPPKPPEPKDDPDFYKELDAYKELEGSDEMPVDVEGILDEDSDGTPEYYYEIEDAIAEHVDVEQYVKVDENNDPDYAPEINSYQGLDPEKYMASQGRQPRSETTGTTGARNEWVEPENLTHYDDIVDLKQILDNGTTEIMAYANDTDVVDTQSMGEFNTEVGQVAVIIANSLKVGYINGTNSTDKNNDGNPEHLVIWKVVYRLEDRNGDKKIDKKVVAAQIFDLYDNNSNGIFEYSKGFQGVLKAYDNNYNGQFEEKIIAVAAGVEAKIDGNYTKHFKRVGVFYNHTIDKNNDSKFELQRAAMYIQLYFDNNSNGNFELVHEFAGGIEGIDNNSNGKYESALLVWAGKVVWDKNDDGLEDINRTTVWILSLKDKNEDTKPEEKWLLHILNLNFDNNSNGNIELKREVIAGYRAIDFDSNGKDERLDAVRAVKHTWDINDNGISDANVSRGHVFLWRDKNQDNNPEYQLALFYLEQNFDNNSNGNYEFTRKLIRGFVLNDPDSDGIINELRAVHYGIITIDINDNGKMNYAQGFGYAIHLKDKDGDSNLEYKRAVFGFENRWDNNTDGVFETVNQLAAGYEGIDNNDDGQLDIERFFILANRTIDRNNDGNPELRQITLMTSLRVYNSTGTIIFGRNVLHSTVAYDNNSNGNFELMRCIILGHVGYNGTLNGSKVDWETEKALLIFMEFKDTDDNGTWDKKTFFKVKTP